MIFFLNLDGTCTRQDTDHIYQGSNNVSKVIAITSIAPVQSHLGVAFTLPNGLTVGYLPMASKGAYNVKDNPVPMYLWTLDLPYNVTDVQGTVGVSFNVVTNITKENLMGINQTSYTNTFEVEYSALPTFDKPPTQDEWEQILNLLEAYAAVNPGIVEKLENFQIGTVTAQASEPGGQPEVTAEIISETTPNGYKLNMDFTLPRGAQGTPAGFGTITVEATKLPPDSEPTVEATATGSDEAKNFDFKFGIPQGEQGEAGEIALYSKVFIRYLELRKGETFVSEAENFNRTPITGEYFTAFGYKYTDDGLLNILFCHVSDASGSLTRCVLDNFYQISGTDGVNGVTPNISVTAVAETVPYGQSAEAKVTESGSNTAKNFAFDFKIPEGNTPEFDAPSASTFTGGANTEAKVSVEQTQTEDGKEKLEFSFTIPRGANGYDGNDGMDGSGMLTLKTAYTTTTTTIPIAQINVPWYRNGLVHSGDTLFDTAGNVFLVKTGNDVSSSDSVTVEWYDNLVGATGKTALMYRGETIEYDLAETSKTLPIYPGIAPAPVGKSNFNRIPMEEDSFVAVSSLTTTDLEVVVALATYRVNEVQPPQNPIFTNRGTVNFSIVNYKEIKASTGVTSVNGQTGDVSITQSTILGSTAVGSSTTPIYYDGSKLVAGTKPTLQSLVGTSAIGSASQPVYWNGSGFIVGNVISTPKLLYDSSGFSNGNKSLYDNLSKYSLIFICAAPMLQSSTNRYIYSTFTTYEELKKTTSNGGSIAWQGTIVGGMNNISVKYVNDTTLNMTGTPASINGWSIYGI